MSAVALTAVHVSSEDEFLVWLYRHPEASRRQAWEAGIEAARAELWRVADGMKGEGVGLCLTLDLRFDDLI